MTWVNRKFMTVTMRTIFLILMAIVCAQYAIGETLEPQILRFASGTQSEPFTRIEDDQVSGIYNDVLAAAFSDSDYRIKVTTFPPARVIWELKQGAIDLFPHLQADGILDYQQIPNTLVCDRVLFSVRMSLFNLQGMQQSASNGKRPTRVGWVRYHHIDTKDLDGYIPENAEVVYAKNYKQLVKMLVGGRVDYVVSSAPNFYANLQVLAPHAVVEEQQHVLPSAVVRIGFSTLTLKTETEKIRGYFCQALAAMHAKGVVDEIVSRYSHLNYFDPL